MQRFRRVSVMLGGLSILLAGLGAHGASRSDAKEHERVAQALKQIKTVLADSDAVPGIAVGISNRERLLGTVLHGYADLKARKPVTAETKFAIGSISKSFTSVVLMQMADAGKFDPAVPVSRYLPQLRVNSAFPEITGHSLLNHTSGLPNYLVHLSSMRYAIYALRDFQPTYAPGTHFAYSNTGYQLLGYVTERIDGDAFASILERRLLAPLGMRATVPQMDETVRPSLAISYERSPQDGSFVEANWFPYIAADGGIASTAGDMDAFARLLLNRGATPNGRIISEAAFQKIITSTSDDATYGYGVQVSTAQGHTVVGHGGAIYAFNSHLEAHIDEGFAVTILGNARLDGEVIGKIVGIASKAVGGDGKPGEFRKYERLPVEDVNDTSAYEGTYQTQDGGPIVFSKAPGGLSVQRADGTRFNLTRVGRDIYSSRQTGAYLFFVDPKQASGSAQGVSNGAAWYTKHSSAGEQVSATPPEYRAYVGRYRNHADEGPDVRVFVRGGRLMVAPSGNATFSEELVAVGPGLFRPAAPEHSPERFQFDTLDDGVTLRLQATGVPLYRVDMP
ncbi:serine hydrolase domain-containing protein [Steroidobacter sp.]|uniref:serine hydrolase domain-containing protein n=1 Tax=Steroidobacter sp. TaxID=1978227 RepID=UPI001A543BDC|nr:serine hydrolase domain-containing protein [Steroidobacter sp.]MBL8267358.1 beta-lactamase family protein [Steroidobacter sp.]